MRGRSPHRGRTPSKPRVWYEVDGGFQLAQDRAAISEDYPGLEIRLDAAGGARLEGVLVLEAACGVPTRIPLRVEFAPGYPRIEPSAYDASARFPHIADRHFYEDGRCCLWLPPESRWNPTDRAGLRAFLDEVAVFLERQLIYDSLPPAPDGRPPKWPWPERSHGILGYLEWVIDMFGGNVELVAKLLPEFAETSSIGRNYPCPCGSGLRFKSCHLTAVEEIRSRAGRLMVCRIFRALLAEFERRR